jgi:hypothetical protein
MTDKDNEQSESFADTITKELLTHYDVPQAIAVLSSIIVNIYQTSDKNNAFVLAQPGSNVAVVTTSLDTLDHLPEVLRKTFEAMETIEEPSNDDDETPPNSKLH